MQGFFPMPSLSAIEPLPICDYALYVHTTCLPTVQQRCRVFTM